MRQLHSYFFSYFIWFEAAALAAGLAGCAYAPAAPDNTAGLFHDRAFAAPSERISTDDAFALNAAMRRYLAVEIAGQLHAKGAQAGLAEALYNKEELKLEYDSARTKTAAEAFDSRSGNCLSLVLMTAALAKELQLPLDYGTAVIDDVWSRRDELLVASGHVFVTLGRRLFDVGSGRDLREITIDFLPGEDVRRLRRRKIDEPTVLAMFANNRAAEALAGHRVDDAYAWSRLALRHDPSFLASWNTLGVVYLRHGDPAFAAEVFEHVLAAAPRDTRSLANLAEAYTREGRVADASAVRRRLVAIEPNPPFHFLRLGLEALQRDDVPAARALFAREAERSVDDDEVHYWLGVADWRLGDLAGARKELALAMETSTSARQHQLYAAKLAWLRGAAANTGR